MRIAVIGAKGLPAKQGGVEHYCQELYANIVTKGYSVDLFARSSYTNTVWFSCYYVRGIRVICLPSLPFKGLDALTSSVIGAIAALIRGYDLVHFHALGPALFSWIPKISSSSRVVVTCHGLDWQRAKWDKLSRSIIRWGERIAANCADELVVVSEYLLRYFQNTYGIETTYIPTAPARYAEPDPQCFYLNSLGLKQKRYILFLGRLVPEKRPDLLIKAFLLLKPQGWKLVIAGGTSNTPLFTSKLVNLTKGDENVIFTGAIHGHRLSEIVRWAGLFVLPSDLEGLPMVILEAMNEKIPVLASDIPPHRQLIGQDRGLLFRAGDLNSCADRLEQALSQHQELAAMAEKAHRYVKANYNWNKITLDNLALYEKNTIPPVLKRDRIKSR